MRPIDADTLKGSIKRALGGASFPHLMAVIVGQIDKAPTIQSDEPRVMTYGEMMKAEIGFLEVKGIERIYPFIRYEVDIKSYWSSPYTNNEDNPFEMVAEQEEYLLSVRCWTSRPTDEQRKAVEWDG